MAETSQKGITVDEKFLQNFLAKGGEAQTPTGRKITAENADEILAQAVGEKSTATHTKATQQLSKPDKDKSEAAKQREAQRQSEQERRELLEESRQQKQQLNAAQQAVNSALTPLKSAADRVASAKTVGGVGLLVVILIILLFVVVQVNKKGDTRLKMIWYMLNGRATLEGRVTPKAATPENYSNEDNAVATAFSQLESDASKVIENAAQTSINDAAQGVTDTVGSWWGALGSDFNQVFRNLP